jgi:hypothetical protein
MVQTDRGAAGREDGTGVWSHPPALDRRASERFTVLDHRGWLGQWSGRSFEIVEVHLVDLSRGGVLFEVDEAPDEHQTSLLGLDTLREDWCLEVKVVRIRRGRRKRYRVHGAFTQACSDEFFAAALNGPVPVPGGAAGPARASGGTLV